MEEQESASCPECDGQGRWLRFAARPDGTAEEVEVVCEVCGGSGLKDAWEERDDDGR